MKFDDFDKKMRKFEMSRDTYIDNSGFLCARLDGRGFSAMTEKNFEKPFDIKFSELMRSVSEHLMNCGFKIMLAYTQSDEISLLFDPSDTAYNHKERKLISVLAGEASAYFSVNIGFPVCFDCRLIPLPSENDVKDYFSWRQSDLLRNSLDSHCYYALLKSGKSGADTAELLSGKQPDFKFGLLKEYGIDYEKLPSWQKYGTVLYSGETEKSGTNPITGEPVKYIRKETVTDIYLPHGEQFGEYIKSFLKNSR